MIAVKTKNLFRNLLVALVFEIIGIIVMILVGENGL